MSKEYIGDGAYADFDGFGIVLTTENGISVQNTVYLEPGVFAALLRYAATHWNRDGLIKAIGGDT